jgi:hypothetical protein
MKKVFLILFLILFASSNLFAKDYKNSFSFFNLYLQDNGYIKYLARDSNGRLKNNLNIKTHPNKWGIHYPSNPNRDSLIYYFYKYQFSHLTGDPNTYQWGQIEIKPSSNPYEFKFKIQEDKFVKKQIKTKGIVR